MCVVVDVETERCVYPICEILPPIKQYEVRVIGIYWCLYTYIPIWIRIGFFPLWIIANSSKLSSKPQLLVLSVFAWNSLSFLDWVKSKTCAGFHRSRKTRRFYKSKFMSAISDTVAWVIREGYLVSHPQVRSSRKFRWPKLSIFVFQ